MACWNLALRFSRSLNFRRGQRGVTEVGVKDSSSITHSCVRRPGFLGLNLTNGAAAPRVLAEGFRATDKLSKRPTGGGIGTFCTGSAAAGAAAEEGSITGAGLSVGFSGGVVGSPETEAGLLGVATPRLATGRGFAFNFGGIMSNVGRGWESWASDLQNTS